MKKKGVVIGWPHLFEALKNVDESENKAVDLYVDTRLWTMQLWSYFSLQKVSIKQLPSYSEPFAVAVRYFYSSKFIQTQCKIIEGSKGYSPNLSAVSECSFSPAFISISNLLSQCTAFRNVSLGMKIHAYMITSGLSKYSSIRNCLINFYSKCHFFLEARKLTEASCEPDLVSWSALISGYAQNGLGEEAVSAFREMLLLGVKSNEFTFPSVLKACSMTKDLKLGKQIHGIALVTGFESDVFVANTLVVMYAKCGELGDSKILFEGIPWKNVVSWNALFSCLVQYDLCREAVNLFQEMLISGTRPNEFSLSSLLNACAGLEDGGNGRKLHGYLIKLGYDRDPFSLNALVDMYAKVGYLEDSVAVFESIKIPDIVSWNAVIAGCVRHGYHDWAIELFRKMGISGVLPNMFTLSSVLKACAGIKLIELGKQFHSLLVKRNLESDPFVSVGLIDMYAKCDLMSEARNVYNFMQKDLIATNAVISGHSCVGEDKEAISFYRETYKDGLEFNQTTLCTVLKSIAALQAAKLCEQIHSLSIKSGLESDVYVSNSLLDAYGKCSRIEEAERIFEKCPTGDLVAFTSMTTAYAQYGYGEEAIKLYMLMQNRNVEPDGFIYSSLMNACANLSAYEQGKQIHTHVLKFGFLSEVFAGNSLVNMYAKCGSIDDAGRAFSEIPERGIVSWSAMIGGLAQHGHGKEALHLFHQMLNDGVIPNHITLVSVLCACNHAGLVVEARRYFDSMGELFGIHPMQEHYACMVDILGRAGKLNEAMDLVNKMPFQANGAVWGALLGAARIHKNVEVGNQAAQMLLELEPEKSGTHVILANIYASRGMWENVATVRRLMKDSMVKKEPGMSWIEVRGKVYSFIVGDRSHTRSKEIYAKLDYLSYLLNKAGYVPLIEIDLHDVEPSEKEKLLLHHSEKLAVAFGLIATPPGAPIRVKKNLRVCIDCHTAFKFICKIVAREIILRDINRFHHFKDGSCSCGDYW